MYYDYEDNSSAKINNDKKNIIISSTILLFIIILGIILFSFNKKDKYDFILKNNKVVVLRGERYQLEIQSKYKNNNYIYHIKDLNVARVNDEGNIIGLKEGYTDLIVTSKESKKSKIVKVVVSKNTKEEIQEIEENNNEKNKETVEEFVNESKENTKEVIINPEKIELNIYNKELNINDELLLIPTIFPNNATNKNIIWSSSDTNIVSVNNGNIKALRSGKVVITAKTENGIVANCSIIVKEKIINVESIVLNKTSEIIKIGDLLKLQAIITPNNATNKNINWSSSNSNVAVVDSNGLVKGLSEGTSLIIGKTANGKEASCSIKVIKIKENNNVETKKFQVPLRTSDGNILMGGDPYVKYYNGYYYYLSTTGNDIQISVSKNLQDIGKPEKIISVYKNPYNRVIWAPELHYIQNRWYIYYTNSNGDDYYDRKSYVLRSKTDNPLGEYEYMGQIKDSNHDYYAIDGTPLEWNNNLYFIYSGMPSRRSAGYQYLYIAHMSNPWTIDSERVEISRPTYSWERKNAHINEGPEILIKNNTLHIIYSANGAQSKYYCLGMLTYAGGNILSKSSWIKTNKAVFESANGVYGVGHASFTTSRDLKEDWIVYHAYSDSSNKTIKNWERSIRIKKITWNGNTPVFGNPNTNNSYLQIPSGSI